MKLGLFFVSILTLTGALVACSAKGTTTSADPSNTVDGGGIGDDGATAVDDDDPANQPPHSLGTIVLGESHASGASKSTPLVSATFLPDARSVPYCKTKLEAGCTIEKVAKCTESTTTGTGCAAGSACTLDTTCSPVCQKIPVCETSCADDEVCTAGLGASGTCVKTQSFDAGPIAFSGTTTAITLFPPYAFQGDGSGAPFLGGSTIRVQAQGATEAGFNKFDETFTATTFIQTSPGLSKIPRAQIFGSSSVPIGWAPGSDTIVITVGGAGGTATCTVDDSLGTFSLPRSVVTAALGTPVTGGTAALSLSVSRQKKEVHKDQTAKGTLTSGTVQPVGWLDLVTLSSESAEFQGCAGTASICGDTCADLQTDTTNCGACGKTCTSGQACNAGTCGGSQAACSACVQSAESGTCAASSNACSADTSCSAIITCVNACTNTTCQSACVTSNPAGATKFNTFNDCLNTACSAECN